jgi:hypothetical protein
MTHAMTRILARALLAAAIALALWLSPLSAQEKPGKDEDAKSSSEDALTKALERRLAGKASLDDVMIDVRWRFDDVYTPARVFGDGVGVWNRSVGVRVPRAQVRALIRKLASSRFGSLPDSAGDEESRVLTGRIVVSAGAVRKAVSQTADGTQSPLLKDVAEGVLRLCKKAAGDGGVHASSFEDGFAEIVSGKLGPGALELRMFRKPPAGGSPTAAAWDLHIFGLYVYDRQIGGAHDTARQLRLSNADFQALARELSAANIGTLPGNLYAPTYTDLNVSLLDQHKSIQARAFSGMTPQTHGEKQAAFDRLAKTLEALRDRVLHQGKKVDAIDLVGPAREEHEGEEHEKEQEKEKD